MKITKSSIIISKDDWETIGKEAGWFGEKVMAPAALGLSLMGDPSPVDAKPPKAPIQQTAPQEQQVDEHTKFVARVIFAEGCGAGHEALSNIAGVIKNRVNNKPFGGRSSMYGVVTQKNAFECINDSHNKNWALSEHPEKFTGNRKQIWDDCVKLAQNPPSPKGPSGRPLVYYHDTSIPKPRGWDNKYWKAIKEAQIGNLIFYSVVPAKH